MPRKPKLYEYEPDAPELTIGSYNSFTEVPTTDKPKKLQIGFIRQKCHQNNTPKTPHSKSRKTTTRKK